MAEKNEIPVDKSDMESVALEYSGLQQQMQNSYIHKENLRLELNDILSAINELKTAKGDVFKQSGVIIIKSNPDTLTNDLEEKKEMLEIKLKSLEKKDLAIKERLQKIQHQFMSKNK